MTHGNRNREAMKERERGDEEMGKEAEKEKKKKKEKKACDTEMRRQSSYGREAVRPGT